MDQLGKCQYFSTLDLASGYHQIKLEEKNIEKLPLTQIMATMNFWACHLSLKISHPHFNVLWITSYEGSKTKNAQCNLMIIIIFSVSPRTFTTILKRFLRKEVADLGHLVTPQEVELNPNNIIVIQNFPVPKTEKQIKLFRTFRVLASFHKRLL